jgi:hypothetical protein
METRTPHPSRSLESARERVIQVLGVHFANNDVNGDELDRRLTRAFQARSEGALEELLADLPRRADTIRGQYAVGPRVITSDAAPARGFLGAFMGGTVRKGEWHLPRHFKVSAVMGGVELDLRHARIAPGVTEIEVFVLMGGVEIVVPRGVRVEAMGAVAMGGFEVSAGDAPADTDPSQPVIRLTGLVLMGGVEARHQKLSTKALGRFEKRLARIRAKHGE